MDLDDDQEQYHTINGKQHQIVPDMYADQDGTQQYYHDPENNQKYFFNNGTRQNFNDGDQIYNNRKNVTAQHSNSWLSELLTGNKNQQQQQQQNQYGQQQQQQNQYGQQQNQYRQQPNFGGRRKRKTKRGKKSRKSRKTKRRSTRRK